MVDELAPFGRYPNGKAISEHPSAEEIEEQREYYMALVSAEQREVLEEYYNAKYQLAIVCEIKNKPVEEAMEIAVKRWAYFWPHEAKYFFEVYMVLQRETMNRRGWNKDGAKIALWEGAIPQRVRNILTQYQGDLFDKNSPTGQSEGFKLFFKVVPKATLKG